MKKLSILFLTAGFAVCSAVAQTAVKDALEGVDASGGDRDWTPGIFIGGGISEGNSESINIDAGATMQRKRSTDELMLAAEFNFGEAAVFTDTEVEVQNPETGETETQTVRSKGDKLTNTDKITGDAQYNYFLSDDQRLYALVAGDYLKDDIATVDYRVTVGPGLGYYFFKNDDATFGLEAGPTYLFEDVGGVEDDGVGIRIGQRYERQLSENAKLVQSLEYLPLIDDFEDYLLDFKLGVEAALTGNKSLKIAITDIFDNTPAAGLEENDLSITAGIVFTLD